MQDFYITMLLTNLETMYTMDIKQKLKKNEEMRRIYKPITFNAIKENIIGLFDTENLVKNLDKYSRNQLK